jgi:hypothetical protein
MKQTPTEAIDIKPGFRFHIDNASFSVVSDVPEKEDMWYVRPMALRYSFRRGINRHAPPLKEMSSQRIRELYYEHKGNKAVHTMLTARVAPQEKPNSRKERGGSSIPPGFLTQYRQRHAFA